METPRPDDLYDILGASTLADPVPPAEGRPRLSLAGRAEPAQHSMCPMEDVPLDRDGNPID